MFPHNLGITQGHGLGWLALAVAISLFASITSFTLLQRSISGSARFRRGWVLLAGLTIGVGGWTTQFAALMGAAPDMHFGIDSRAALTSVVLASLLSTAGWMVSMSALRGGAVVGGALVGMGLASAHYIDVVWLAVDGTLVQDDGILGLALASGVSLCVAASWFKRRIGRDSIPILPGVVLSVGMLSLHFIGMAALTMVPGPPTRSTTHLLETRDVGSLIVFATVLLLTVAAFVAYIDRKDVRRKSSEKRRMEAVIAALRESEERYRLAAKATSDALWLWRHDNDTIDWGDGISARMGYEEARLGTSLSWWSDRVHPDDLAGTQQSVAAALAGSSPEWSGEYRFLKGDGAYADIHAQAHIVRDDHGVPRHTVGAMIDITDRKNGERNLRWAAEHDALTKIPNRLLFNAKLDAQLKYASPLDAVTLILIDIDHFKAINDTLGHGTGDALLIEIAQRLKASAPPGSLIARLGGDEFAVLIYNYSADDVLGGAQAMIQAVKQPFDMDGRQLDASVSAGAAIWPHDAAAAGDLLKAADLALYAAKAEGRAVVRRFRPEMRDAIDRRAAMLSAARKALDHEHVVPFYQPKVSLATGRLTGFESLLRWHHSEHGLQSPGMIAAAFEDFELSAQLTDRMVDKILIDMRRWLDAGLDFGSIAVNGSAADFRRGDFADRLLERLFRADISPSYLELEVTETVFVGQIAELVEATLRTVSNAGMTVALDDFGTGYASLTHLRQFPVDTIKIDRSFVSRLSDSAGREDDAIVNAVISLAHNLGMGCVAEGVETLEQAAQLQGYGCDAAQGFLFSRPIAADRVPRLIQDATSSANKGGLWNAGLVGTRRRAANSLS